MTDLGKISVEDLVKKNDENNQFLLEKLGGVYEVLCNLSDRIGLQTKVLQELAATIEKLTQKVEDL